MKNFIYSLFIMTICLMGVYSSTSRNYSFSKDSALEREFDNVYYALEHLNPKNIWLQDEAKLWLDSDKDSFVNCLSDDYIQFVAGNNAIFEITSGQARANNGIIFGAATDNTRIDDAPHGSGSSSLYIGNQTITTSSDRRLKTNISSTTIDALDLLSQFNVVDFDWSDQIAANDGRKQRGTYTGLIAQDVYHITQWAVNTQGASECAECLAGESCTEHNLNWQLEYKYIIPVLIKATQDLIVIIEELNERIIELEK